MGVLAPQSGIEPLPLAVEVQTTLGHQERPPFESLDLESLHPNLRISELGIVNGINQLRNLVAKSVVTGARKAM